MLHFSRMPLQPSTAAVELYNDAEVEPGIHSISEGVSRRLNCSAMWLVAVQLERIGQASSVNGCERIVTPSEAPIMQKLCSLTRND